METKTLFAKRILYFLLVIALSLVSQTVVAAPGGSGEAHYYYTDIKTYFFGAPITAYNLGGRTAIVCEDLNWHYGHDVYWLAGERKLTVDKKDYYQFASLQALAGETLKHQDGETGAVAGNVYETDITAFLNGRLIESFNIGGQTVIIAEDMRDYGYEIEWDEHERTLSVTGNDSNFKTETDIGIVMPVFSWGIPGGGQLQPYNLVVDGLLLNIDSPYSIYAIYAMFVDWVSLAPTLSALGAEYEWDADLRRFTVTSFDSDSIKTVGLAPPATELRFDNPPQVTPIDLQLFFQEREIPIGMEMYNRGGYNHRSELVLYQLNPVVYNGVVYVPLKAIADCLGLELAGWY